MTTKRQPNACGPQGAVGSAVLPEFHLAIDSGAHSVYNMHFEGLTGGVRSRGSGSRGGMRGIEHASFAAHVHKNMMDRNHLQRYLRNASFRKYVEDYGNYLREHTRKLDFAVTLDIIADAQASYDIWREYDDAGVRTLPVFHYGEDFAFLKRYMDATDYIGISGRYNLRAPVSDYALWARKVFKLLCDEQGRPKWKVHGFAVSAFEVMAHYPWYSIDATTPFYLARTGSVTVPRRDSNGGSFNYFCEPANTVVSSVRITNRSYLHASPLWRKHVDEYLHTLGLSADGVHADYAQRDIANLVYYQKQIEAIWLANRDRPLIKAYVSGNPASNIKPFIAALEVNARARASISEIRYLGTYWNVNPMNYLLERGLYDGNNGNGKSKNRSAAIRAQTRPTLHRHG